jgi:hypothetical protein
MSDGHAGAVQPQPLGELTAGRTLEDTPLNPEWRRGVGANIHQAHFSATRQTLHWLSQPLSSRGKFSAPKCVENVLLGLAFTFAVIFGAASTSNRASMGWGNQLRHLRIFIRADRRRDRKWWPV